MLNIKKMARSTFYYNLHQLGKPDVYDDLRRRIRQIFIQHKQRYGYRRITDVLRNEGELVNHKLVQRLMQEMGLRAKVKGRRYNSYKGEVGKKAPNILNRHFKADKPNQKWTTDITQVTIRDHKLYVSSILDMYNGEIVSCVVSNSPGMKLVLSMANKAFRKFDSLEGLIMHSDQGWQYRSPRYQDLLKAYGITQSMSRKGNCLDNAIMESFFGIMKNELLYLREWKSPEEFKTALSGYIRYYNNDRIKLRLNGLSPVQYRTQNI